MLIAQISNPAPVDYRVAFPNTSFPANGPDEDFLAENGYAKVSQFKDHDRTTQKLVPAAPYYEAPWVYAVTVVDKTAEELAAERATANAALLTSVVDATQKRLDDFARTRNYDGILSACTYATDPFPKFAAEGQYCVDARSATWAKLYEMLAEVEAGTRPVPSGFPDIEPELPALEWPNT